MSLRWWYVPTVQHAELARTGVNVAVGTANLLRLGAVALGRAVGDGALLRDAIADRDFENVTSRDTNCTSSFRHVYFEFLLL